MNSEKRALGLGPLFLATRCNFWSVAAVIYDLEHNSSEHSPITFSLCQFRKVIEVPERDAVPIILPDASR